MCKRFRNLKAGTLIAHLAVTLAYPVWKGLTAGQNALLVFTDTLTILALLLVVAGIVYALVLKGDLDLSGYVFRRGLSNGREQNYRAYRENRKEEREAAFNYPLFLGILYLLVSAVFAYGLL